MPFVTEDLLLILEPDKFSYVETLRECRNLECAAIIEAFISAPPELVVMASDNLDLHSVMVGRSYGEADQQMAMRSLTWPCQLLSITGRTPFMKTARSNLDEEFMDANGLDNEQISHKSIPKL